MEFSINVDKEISTLLSKAKQKITQGGGKFNGNEQKGAFEGKGVKGEYSIIGQMVKINIIKKPIFASESRVKNEITKFFTS
jgi:hypothetical protein